MKKDKTKSSTQESTIRSEYDFTQGIRGKHYKAYRQGHRVTIYKVDGTKVMQNFKLEKGEMVLDYEQTLCFKK